MNRQEHLVIGILIFLPYFFLINSIFKSANYSFLYGIIATSVGSIIPDIFEAPTSWLHRGICHSKRALKIVSILFVITALVGLLSSIITSMSIFYLVSCFFLGYTFHLLADATTTVGLPD